MEKQLVFDEINYWSEIKLDIVKRYAQEYSRILTKNNFYHVYIDAFAGPGIHISKSTGEMVDGSPVNALSVQPPFKEFFFIDIKKEKIRALENLVEDRKDVNLFEGDCNEILLESVFPKVRYEDWKRGLCLLDPYGLHLDWSVIEQAGKQKSIELFINLPVMDINRNAIWREPKKVNEDGIRRMNQFWGDDTWRRDLYEEPLVLFGDQLEKLNNEEVASKFCSRLREKAGFDYVSKPMPMKNSRNSIVYYLVFAAQRPVAGKIVDYIINKYSG